MKDKIIMLIIGIIIGAIIASACFWFASSVIRNDKEGMPNMERGGMKQEQNFDRESSEVRNTNTVNNNS